MKNQITILLFIFLGFFSCKNSDPDQFKDTNYQLNGYVQKGPFAIGSEINIYELDEEFIPTGRTFHTTIEDMGYFELNDVSLISSYVELLADGFYFNEISGELSNERISLKAIVDLRETTLINVNVLTNLEYERVRYLLKTEGLDIDAAKLKAQHEILTVFKMDEVLIGHPEQLDIVKNDYGDAVLLAISSIMQGNTTTAELSLNMSKIIYDLKEDGEMSDSLLQSRLLGQAMALAPDNISANLKSYYLEYGIEIEQVDGFKDYLNQYISLSGGVVESPFFFPEKYDEKINVLDSSQTVFLPNVDYTVAVDMPKAGSIKIIIRQTGGEGTMGYWANSEYGWYIAYEDNEFRTLSFNSTMNSELINDPMYFFGYGVADVEYYFNEAETPSIVKNISWGGYNNSDFYFFNDAPQWTNLLSCPDSTILASGADYSIELQRNEYFETNFVLEYDSNSMTIDVLNGEGHTFEFLDNKINIQLSGTGIKGIILHIEGEGSIRIKSDLEFRDGSLLERIVVIE